MTKEFNIFELGTDVIILSASEFKQIVDHIQSLKAEISSLKGKHSEEKLNLSRESLKNTIEIFGAVTKQDVSEITDTIDGKPNDKKRA